MVTHGHGLSIELVHGTEAEAGTRELLVDLLDTYALDKWRYAETVRIEDGAIPHSHPVLTLNTAAWPDRSLRLLSNYVHEQLHWFTLLEQHEGRAGRVWQTFRRLFPSFPVGLPDGCGDEFSNYLHVTVNYLELLALEELIGAGSARAHISGKPFYRAIYGLVLAESQAIHRTLEQFDMIPPDLPPRDKRFVTPDR